VGTKPDEIVNRIDRQRDQLGENLHELESRLRDATDWRLHYKRHPWVMISIATGAGFLLGSWMRSGSHSNGEPHRGEKPAKRQISEALRGAIITLVVNKLKEYVSAQLPSPQQQA
jgi:hypothetical protein